mgnify:CR=1 FL=1
MPSPQCRATRVQCTWCVIGFSSPLLPNTPARPFASLVLGYPIFSPLRSAPPPRPAAPPRRSAAQRLPYQPKPYTNAVHQYRTSVVAHDAVAAVHLHHLTRHVGGGGGAQVRHKACTGGKGAAVRVGMRVTPDKATRQRACVREHKGSEHPSAGRGKQDGEGNAKAVTRYAGHVCTACTGMDNAAQPFELWRMCVSCMTAAPDAHTPAGSPAAPPPAPPLTRHLLRLPDALHRRTRKHLFLDGLILRTRAADGIVVV